MTPVWIRKAFCIGLIFAAHALIAGCIFPLPSGYDESSRENLSTDITERLEVGVSTREEVLFLLGEPDGVGPNDSWWTYGSVYSEGGVVFFVCSLGGGCVVNASEKVEYKRLIVTFDELGLMTNAEFVDRECWKGIGPGGIHESPCMRVYMPDSSM